MEGTLRHQPPFSRPYVVYDHPFQSSSTLSSSDGKGAGDGTAGSSCGPPAGKLLPDAAPAPKSDEDPPAGAVVDLADDYVFRLDVRVSKLEDEVRILQAIVRDWVKGPWK